MHTVLGVDLEPGTVWLIDDFVYARRTITLRGFGILGQVYFDRYRLVSECEVTRLVLFMVGVGEKHR